MVLQSQPFESAAILCRCNIFLPKRLKPMVAGHLVTFAAFFVETHPSPGDSGVHLLDAHSDSDGDAREGICEQGDDGPIPKADDTGTAVRVLRLD